MSSNLFLNIPYRYVIQNLAEIVMREVLAQIVKADCEHCSRVNFKRVEDAGLKPGDVFNRKPTQTGIQILAQHQLLCAVL